MREQRVNNSHISTLPLKWDTFATWFTSVVLSSRMRLTNEPVIGWIEFQSIVLKPPSSSPSFLLPLRSPIPASQQNDGISVLRGAWKIYPICYHQSGYNLRWSSYLQQPLVWNGIGGRCASSSSGICYPLRARLLLGYHSLLWVARFVLPGSLWWNFLTIGPPFLRAFVQYTWLWC